MTTNANPVGWFEIPVNDLNRAKAFYEAVFGYILTVANVGPLQMAWFPMNSEARGAAGSLVLAESYVPSKNGILIYFTVTDIPVVLERVVANKGIELLPRTSIGEYGYIGRFIDTEGNIIALHSVA